MTAVRQKAPRADPGTTLARAVGHELNNPLTSALLDVAEALNSSGVPPGVEVRLQSIAVALGRLRALAAELQLVEGPDAITTFDLAEVCRRVASLAPHERIDLELESFELTDDSARIHQLVLAMINGMHPYEDVTVRASDAGVIRVTGHPDVAIDAVRSDLVGAARGERFLVERPSKLAQTLAQDLGLEWRRHTEGDLTTVEVHLGRRGPG